MIVYQFIYRELRKEAMQGKQAKMLTIEQEQHILHHVQQKRYPLRDRVMVLLSIKAGMRAKEIALLTWAMVTDADGAIARVIALPNRASKGKSRGRTIPIHPLLHEALETLYRARHEAVVLGERVIFSERGGGMTAGTVRLWFHRLYSELQMTGCSSNSGRRTFITRAARRVARVGGSLRDVQHLAGHANLATTQRYIETDTETRHQLVALL